MSQVIHKLYHTVLASGIYMDACKEWRKIPQTNERGLGSRSFAEKYHNLNLNQKLSAGQTGHHRANTVVPTGDISFTLNNLTLSTTTEHSHVDHLAEKNAILARPVQY